MDQSAAPGLSIRLFSSFEACLGDAPLPRLRTRKGQWLLALLTLRPGAEIDRPWLAGTLWPDSAQAAALANLRSVLKDLRQALGTEAERLRCPTTRTLSLDLADAAVDVHEFDAAITSGDPASLRLAVELYRGPLLEGCHEEWAFQERQVREQAYLSALEILAAQAHEDQDASAAERYLRRAVAVDPLRERAYRTLMQVLAAGGSYAAALLVYRELRQRLHRDINAAPDAETTAFYLQLRVEAREKAGGRAQPPGARQVERDASPPSEISRPRSPETVRHNLPLQLTRFIGREHELGAVNRLLDQTRLLTLTGAGGCGKTRLALQVATDRVEEYPQGVWLVELAALADPSLVPAAVATALRVREEPDLLITQTLTDFLAPRQLLLMLDNCEHLVEACAALTEALLQRCPELRILATSREPFGLFGETTYRVPSLSVPSVSGDGGLGVAGPSTLLTPDALMQYEAVQLFLDRATSLVPSFVLTDQNAGAVAQICRDLDGIPLAVELAAACVKALPLKLIAARLDDRFRLLTGGSRTALPRHQTLRALIDWSYDLLSEPERRLLRWLSVFAGGWTLEAAEGICAGEDIEAWEVVGGLAALVTKSLVQYEAGEARFGGEANSAGGRAPGGPEARYRMLETVRQYSRGRLLEAGEAAALRDRHRDWFVALAEQAEPYLRGSTEQPAWLARLEAESDNLRAALGRCQEAVNCQPSAISEDSLAISDSRQPGTHEAGDDDSPHKAGLRLAAALTWFWIKHGDLTEGWERAHKALSGGAGAPAPERGKALVGAMWLAQYRWDHSAEADLAAEGLRLGRETRDQWLTALSYYHSGYVAFCRGNREQAQVFCEEGLAVARQLGNKWVIASLLPMLGDVATTRGHDEQAKVLHNESLDLFRELEDTGGIAAQLGRLGGLAQRQHDYEQAEALYSEALALAREVNDRVAISGELGHLGGLAMARGDLAATRAHWSEAVILIREMNAPANLAWAISQLGHVACRQGDYETATALHQESLVIWQRRDDTGGVARARYRLGIVARYQGDYPKARALHAQSLSLWQELGDKRSVAWALEQLAPVAEAQGRPLRAARLLGAAAALREAGSTPITTVERPDYERCVASARAAMGEEALAAAWAEGQAMSMDQAVNAALEESAHS